MSVTIWENQYYIEVLVCHDYYVAPAFSRLSWLKRNNYWVTFFHVAFQEEVGALSARYAVPHSVKFIRHIRTTHLSLGSLLRLSSYIWKLIFSRCRRHCIIQYVPSGCLEIYFRFFSLKHSHADIQAEERPNYYCCEGFLVVRYYFLERVADCFREVYSTRSLNIILSVAKCVVKLVVWKFRASEPKPSPRWLARKDTLPF